MGKYGLAPGGRFKYVFSTGTLVRGNFLHGNSSGRP
jgi:hypothetical protein